MYFITNLVHSITMPIRTIYGWLSRLIPGATKFPAISLAMRVALTAFFFLLVVYISAIISYSFSETAAYRSWWVFAAIFLLVIIIPVVVYYLIKIWMTKEESRFPDIDRIWQAGLEECHNNGISLMNVPLFLVQGARDSRQATQLMRASQIPFSVIVPAQEESDIIFFANSDAVFLFLNGCSCISRLSSAPSGPPASVRAPADSGSAQAPPMGTIDASMFESGGSPSATMAPSAPAAPDAGQTLTDSSAFPPTPTPSPVAQPAAAGVGGTMLLPEGQNISDLLAAKGPSDDAFVSTPQLSSQDIYDREQKLRYVCGLISKARQTLCPINGVVSLLPFELVENASSNLQTAAQKDMAVLRKELLVRCSNTVLVTHLEREEGFQELIRRVGEERTRDFRFGKGCELWSAPEGPRLDAIGAHAVGAFEDWIYMLFQEESALQHRYNSRLFMLLCRIRGRFSENLRDVLARGFGFDPQTEGHLAYEQFLFGGCYFSATGADPSRQAFVKSVFLKGIQQEGELEWAPEARRRDAQMQFAANLFALLGAASLLAIVGMLIFQFGMPSPGGP